MPDLLSALYSEFLDGGYDCVDRLVCPAVTCRQPTASYQWVTIYEHLRAGMRDLFTALGIAA